METQQIVMESVPIKDEKPEIQIISPSDVRMKLDRGEGVMLLDIREAHDLNGPLGHLEGIKHIPLQSLSLRLKELEQYRDKLVITICRGGSLAYIAAEILLLAGFPHVAVLEGGMVGWRLTYRP
ncbi:MAG: rhodanese-like domain-containing protein [Candidatus Heimdallarchaeota archaeon]